MIIAGGSIGRFYGYMAGIQGSMRSNVSIARRTGKHGAVHMRADRSRK
jgi:hypothetical protein